MEGDKEGHYEYLDEYKIIKLLGAGYSAEYFFPYPESNWQWTSIIN